MVGGDDQRDNYGMTEVHILQGSLSVITNTTSRLTKPSGTNAFGFRGPSCVTSSTVQTGQTLWELVILSAHALDSLGESGIAEGIDQSRRGFQVG